MDEIKLLKPTMEYAEDIMQFRQEIFDAKDEDAFAGCGSLEHCETAQQWIDNIALMENPDTCPEGRVSANIFVAVRVSDNKIVGVIDLRHHLGNPVLSSWGGHFGYIVRPSERKKGYAKEMVRLNLEKCRELGMHKVMITCDRNNIASERTILANGGVFEKEVPVDGSFTKRFWVTITESMLKTTQNTRELGGYVIGNGQATRRNSLWRSDVQCYPCEEDLRLLKERGITTIIDLRGEKDVARKPSGFAGADGFHYINCPIEEGSGVPESVEAVPASYMAIACAENMPKVFKAIANAESGVMFNCTAGKDRTGVVSAILLLHAGVSDGDIIENYVVTREYGKERLALVHKNFPEIDMNIVTPQEWFMEEFLRLFRERFGTTEEYFQEIGLSAEEIGRITEKLIGKGSRTTIDKRERGTMKHCGTKQIETPRLMLRRFRSDDYTAMYENWASDPEVTRFLTWPTHANTGVSKWVIKEWVNSYEKEDYYQWAIVLKENGDAPIGSISIVDIKEKMELVHIGYCIGRKWWHQGIISEALKAVIDFCFEELKVNRVEARHDPKNPNSGAVMKKCGMIYEGTLRQSDWNNQGICDASYYGMLRSEWEQKRVEK